MVTDWMKELVKNDFNVNYIATSICGHKALFAALRRDAWHFVLCSGTDEDGRTNISISQTHISRYEMAKSAKFLLEFNQQFLDRPEDELIEDSNFGLSIYPDNRFDIQLEFSHDVFVTENGLPESFCEQLKQDIPALTQAKSKVKVDDAGIYILTRSKTFHKNPIASASKDLVTAIAFERQIHKKLDAHKFGIYSAFCTMTDFCATDRNIDEIREHVEGQFQYAPESLSAEILEIFIKVQAYLLDEPIWGIGIKVPEKRAVKILADGMKKLSQVQRAQFVLMNGMHSAGLFFPLAVTTGITTFDHYIEVMTSSLSPDSAKEQYIRENVVFIKMLGDYAGD